MRDSSSNEDLNTRIAALSPAKRDILERKLRKKSSPYIRFEPEEVEQSIAARFEQQARRWATRVAVKTAQHELTYAALNRDANQLAHLLLQERGSGSEPVGLLLEHGAPMVTALLAVLKAGKFYVPLDPAYPRERLAFILDDAEARIVLTSDALIDVARDLAGPKVRILSVDAIASTYSTENPGLMIAPEAFAYLLYTSGSAGQPKGVVENQRNVLHFTMVRTNSAHIAADDRLAMLLSFSFSGSATPLYCALLNGAALHLRYVKETGPSDLARWLAAEQITVCITGAATFRQLVSTLNGSERFPALRLLRIGGEPVYRRDVELFRKHFPPGCLLLNSIGSSEMKNFAEYFIGPDTAIEEDLVPIGYAVEDTEILLVDDDGRPVGVGEIGEIVVKSRFIAPSYWRRPELTQATFQPAPGGKDERLYRTGDLGRRRPDGALVHLGRKDFQVKIRGYRIEIGEIENALLALAGVSAAVVVAREDQPGDRRLVAYVVLSGGAGPQIGAWRATLAAKLPDYMIPASFVVLESLPLTSTGKVDRATLLQPDRDRPLLETPYMEPCSQLEKVLATFWAEVLGLDRVGMHDDFNALGGDSLRGARLLTTVKAVFGVDLPFELLFKDAATVAGMARAIQAAREGPAAGDRHPDASHSARAPTSIRRRQERGAAHLSDTQKRMWFLAKLDPESTAYNGGNAHHLTGAMDAGGLARALRSVVDRHEILRSTYALVGDEPRQTVREEGTVDFQVFDLSGTLPGHRDEALERLLLAETQRPFDLATGPLVRLRLVKLGERESVLLRVMHHMVSDGWSSGIFDGELSTAYNAFVKGREPELPALPIQYADYALWQREWLQGELLERQLGYWKSKLADLPTLELPTDRPRPPVLSYRGAHAAFDLAAPLMQGLKALGRREGATLFMTLLAAFQVLLYRYSGQEDTAVGTPIAGRRHSELEGLIGFFANTLVLRSDLSGNPRFRELLARVRESALGAYTHQDLPFEKLVEELAPARDLSRNPLFQVMFALQHAPASALALEGVHVSRLPLETHSAKFDLSLSVRETPEGLHASWEFSTDLFDVATIERMARHFERLLEGIVADPQQRIGQLPLLTEAERHQLLVQWNDTAADYPRDRCIHQLFEEQAARTPEALAVVFEDQQLTYGELNARANQLAHHLIALGVGPEVLVGICMERSLELIVGLLAILKAGGAYVPLDPGYPVKRLEFMLQNTAAPVLLTQQALLGQLPQYEGRLVCLDRDWLDISAQSVANPPTTATAEALAYVMYTSGSTGNPKGVMIAHQALVNHMTWMDARFPLVSTDRVLQKTSISSDASVWELFAPLISGAQLVLAAPQVHRSPPELVETVRQQAITVLQVVPSMLAAMLDEIGLSQWTALRRLYCGGEVLEPEMARRFRAQSSIELTNLYGPTEATIDATYCVCLPEDSQQTIAIGRPIANTRIYILNVHGEPVPVGVPGELYVGGVGLARGYLNRPELTAEKFLPDPFSLAPGARMYRTGDLARYLPDGNIEFLGRIDDQVKIRGFRIELGEIDTVLAEHPAVRQAVVVVREDTPGHKRLVAYVVPADASLADIEPLRALLRERLPEYMLPAAYVVLKRLPLTPNGKVDRRALPAPKYGREELGGTFVPPRDSLEELITEVWREVLKLEQVGVHDNFFELGGHSLLATQVVARLAKLLKVELPLRGFFESPTVSALAVAVEKRLGAGEARETKPIAPASRTGDLRLSFAQQRLWFLDRLLPAQDTYNIPTAWRLRGRLDAQALQRSVDELVARHETLRTRFALSEGQPVQIIEAAQSVALPMTDLSAMPQAGREAQARQIANVHAHQPFDLEAGPLLRAQLLRLTAEEHLLLLNVHHIASDGWSVGVFDRELSAAYDAFVKGREPGLPALPIQYADYAAWQREWLQGEVLESQLAYWKAQLADLPTLELPTDRPRPPVLSYRGAHAAFDLAAPLMQGLKALGRREGATLFMTLLAAFQVLLYRYSGEEDIAVGTPIAGRRRTELEGLIGFFANTLVLRSDLSGNPRFRELLGRVRESALGAYTHQDLPFEKLVEELAPARDLSRNPLFQAMFVLQNAPGSTLALEGVEVSRVPLEGHSAKFDLSLSVRESAEGLRASWEYASDLFDASTIERMARHFERLLEAIVADPEQRIGQLPLLTEAERHQLLVEWNDTAADYPRDRCIHQLFEEQAARTPEAVAVVFEEQQLTYAELNARANQLAHHLIGLGVGPEVLVGICVERSLELIVGVLGILKAGGAYVPLDPSYPQARLAFMLKDTQAPVLLTQQALLGQLPHYEEHILCLDRDWAAIAAQPDTVPPCHATAENLAYVIYTSGSTGRPKGVAVPHRGVLRLLLGIDYVQLDERQTFLLLSPISFDASTFELWGALLHGARCAIFRERVPTIETLDEALQRYQVTTLWLTASLFNVIIDEAPQILSGVRQLLTGGEALSPTHVRAALKCLPDVQLINGYGPTESTTFTCCYRIPNPLDETRLSIPIGRPIGNTQVYVLDRYLSPVPVGVAGELCIGGDGLARGYLNRLELTAERFVSDPFATEPEARLYRTGDLVRYLPDGNIEFLGRIDDQVKIRGFRIELGEIEAVLAEHAAVREAVVLAREDTPGDKRLVAYVVPAEDSFADSEPLRAFLRERLPEYMRPAAYVVLEGLPLTPSGKVDRRALPAPQYGREELGSTFVPARNSLEELITEVWREVLKLEQVGVHDNFFELGGHSLLAAQVLARLSRLLRVELPLRRMFEAPTVSDVAAEAEKMLGAGEPRRSAPSGGEIPLRWVFEAPTVAELAARIETYSQQGWQTASTCAVAIQPHGDRAPLFFVSGFGGAILPFQALAKELGPEQPLYVLDVNSLSELTQATVTLESVATQMLNSMRMIQPRGPYNLAGYSLGGKIVYEIAQQLHRDRETVGLLALLDCGAPGYPRMHSFPLRTVSHIKHALSFGPRESVAYLAERFLKLKKYFKRVSPRVYPQVFREDDVASSTEAARAIQAWAQVIYDAWRAYVPDFYPGRLTLVRAEVRTQTPGVVDDDLLMGWAKLAGKGIDIARLHCAHSEMLDAKHAQALARLLHERLTYCESNTPAEPHAAPVIALC